MWPKLVVKNALFNLLPLFFEAKKTSGKSNEIGICTLLCHKHVNLFIYNLMSFFYQTGKNLPVYITDDGTLTSTDIKKLKKYFTVFVEPYKSSEKKMSKAVRKYKNIRKFRFDSELHDLRKKLDAFFLNPFKKFIYLDADLLFFKYPKEIIDWIKSDNNKVLYTAHLPYPKDFYDTEAARLQQAYRFLLSKYFSFPVDPSFNSGFLCVPGINSINFRALDKILRFFYKGYYICSWVSEETALSFSFNYKDFKKLPVEKYVNAWAYDEYLKAFTGKTIALHYSGGVKYVKYKSDAIKLALKTHLFKSD